MGLKINFKFEILGILVQNPNIQQAFFCSKSQYSAGLFLFKIPIFSRPFFLFKILIFSRKFTKDFLYKFFIKGFLNKLSRKNFEKISRIKFLYGDFFTYPPKRVSKAEPVWDDFFYLYYHPKRASNGYPQAVQLFNIYYRCII